MPKIIPIRDLRDTTKISEMCNASPEPIFVTKNGYGDMVLMSMSVYEQVLARADMYKAEAKRREEASRMTYDDYIRSLGIVNIVRPVEEGDIARVAQLSQKSNQMNVLTCRRSEDEIRAFAADPTRIVLALRSSDRFGDLGLVAFVHAKVEGEKAEVLDWVMSCRAMNRRIEFSLAAELERMLVERGVRFVSARWEKTPKNAPSQDLFDRLGFDLVESGEDFRRYQRTIA